MTRRANGLDQILIEELERLRQNERQLTSAMLQLFQERDALLLTIHLLTKTQGVK